MNFPVPPGAIVKADAYDQFMKENSISISEIMGTAESSENAAAHIRKAIVSGDIPSEGRACRLACRIEHAISDKSFKKLKEYIDGI